MDDKCFEHSCEDCKDFGCENTEVPCSDCSHGGQRYVKGAMCKHTLIHDEWRIKLNRRTLIR